MEQLLLYKEDGPTLGFKRDKYAFAKATAEEKSELLRDIIGFVNFWRRSEAFVLGGAVEVRGGKALFVESPIIWRIIHCSSA